MSWPTATIGEVCEVVSGATPKTSNPAYWDGDVPWVTPKDLSDLGKKYLHDTPRKLTDAGWRSCSAKMLPAQSVLFSSRAPIGLVAINTLSVCTNQGFKSMVPHADKIAADYLFWWLRTHRDGLQQMGRGATFKEVSKKIVEGIKIPLPPLAEQKRIAGILDAADELRTKRRESIEQLDTLLQSAFLDMFGDPVMNPKGWDRTTLETFAVKVTDGDHHTPKRTDSGIKLLSARNVRDGEIDLVNTDFVGEAEYLRMIKRCHPEKGDVLISCSGTIGRVSRIRFDEPIVLVRSAALVKIDHARAASAFVEHLLRTDALKRIMLRSAKSSSQANLFQKPIRNLPVFVPPIDLQRRFASIVVAAERHKDRLRSHLAELDVLFESLQSRAFRGEL